MYLAHLLLSCRTQVTSNTCAWYIYLSVELFHIDPIEPAFSSSPGCYATLCWSPHHISTVTTTQKLGGVCVCVGGVTWKQFNRPSVYEQAIGAQWIPHRAIHHHSPERKSPLTFFSFLGKEEECLYMWHHKKLETVIFSSPPCSLPAPTFAPLSSTSPWDTVLLCRAPKTGQVYCPLSPNYTSDPRTSPQRSPPCFRESAGPASGGKSLHSSGWVGATLLPRGCETTWGGFQGEWRPMAGEQSFVPASRQCQRLYHTHLATFMHRVCSCAPDMELFLMVSFGPT